MESEVSRQNRIAAVLPKHRELFYGGSWRAPVSGGRFEVRNPATGDSLGEVSEAGPEDVDQAVRAAHEAFGAWRRTTPLERAAKLRETARRLRANIAELALLDAADCGNPVRTMTGDVNVAAAFLDYFAGLVTEIKGETIPMGPRVVNYTMREPLGVAVRIVPFNHPVNGAFIESAVFADVRQSMRVATEESFGPVMCVIRWDDEEQMLADVNSVEQGLTASIWTRDLATAHRAAARVEAGYVWINASSSHFLGVPFGGFKQSGFGRAECFEELLSYTQVKNVHVKLEP